VIKLIEPGSQYKRLDLKVAKEHNEYASMLTVSDFSGFL
jgi:hypothetical protein